MELGKCWLVLDKYGSNIPKRGVTPAELVLLVSDRKNIIGKHPIHDLVVLGTTKRSDAAEKERLRMNYGFVKGSNKEYKIDKLYPGEQSKLPTTFKETGLYEDSIVEHLEEPKPMPQESELPRIQSDDLPADAEKVATAAK